MGRKNRNFVEVTYPNGYITDIMEEIKGTHFEIKIGCSNEINIYPIFETDTFEDFFDFEENSTIFQVKEFIPLNSHQVGIKIKRLILEKIKDDKFITLDFKGVESFTDSFIQQITTILSEEISFEVFKKKIKFMNLYEKTLLSMLQEKIYIASGDNL